MVPTRARQNAEFGGGGTREVQVTQISVLSPLIFSLYILSSRDQEGTFILPIMEIVPNFYLHPGPFFEPLTPTCHSFLHISGEISVSEASPMSRKS